MVLSPADTLSVLEHYKYLLIFPIVVVEGPIVMILSGFLVYLGFLNPFLAYLVLVVGDMIGDLLYYGIGVYWKRWTWVKKYARFVGYNEKSEAFLERHFARHKGKTFLLAKISHGIGGAVQITAGIAGVSSAEFIFWSLIGTLPKTLILMTLGYYLGTSYLKIDDLFNSIAIAVLIVAAIGVLAYVLAGRFGRKQFDKS